MTSLKLTDEQLECRNMAREFCQKRVYPVTRKLDEEGLPSELVAEMGKLGYLGCSIATEYGGMGLDPFAVACIIEEFARANAGLATLMAAHLSLGCKTMELYGSPEQKKKYLPEMAAGAITSFCLTEPNAGTDVLSIQAKAVPEEDHYILNGEKQFITSADVAKFFVVFCKAEKGPTCFIAERSAEGLSVGAPEKKLGIRSSKTCPVHFQDVKVPAGNMLGELGKGFRVALSVLDYGRLGVAAGALGIAEQAFDEAVDYTQNRVQFGKSISSFQATQFKFADMRVDIDASRYLLHHALQKAMDGERFSIEAAKAKLKASETASAVADENIQMHGGYGYTQDYNAERLWRDARITRIYEGTSEAMRMIIGGAFGAKKGK
ncbi:MAG: acyl-CoA dehydrogenase family protein [Candidatus Zixiibacteriota bacterium]|nr:MAG: acyl-CoA dehydrogenase family protein [candidate division Zixibacteria bacterium]